MEQQVVGIDRLRHELDMQIRRCVQHGMPPDIAAEAEALREALPFTLKLTAESNIPIVLVYPFCLSGFKQQFNLVDLGNSKKAYTYLNPENFLGLTSFSSQKPYLMCDVELGMETRDMNPESAARHIRRKGRYSMNVNQTLGLMIQCPRVFEALNLMVPGTRIKDNEDGRLYGIDFWQFAGKVKMKREDPADHDPRWGSPSYRTLIPVRL